MGFHVSFIAFLWFQLLVVYSQESPCSIHVVTLNPSPLFYRLLNSGVKLYDRVSARCKLPTREFAVGQGLRAPHLQISCNFLWRGTAHRCRGRAREPEPEIPRTSSGIVSDASPGIFSFAEVGAAGRSLEWSKAERHSGFAT